MFFIYHSPLNRSLLWVDGIPFLILEDVGCAIHVVIG